ncbi:MAG: AbrB/MazE/SpoVT family DNA-binding domain-containing protein [Pseudomonadota bacterium]
MAGDFVTLGENGRVVIPASVRQTLQLKKGDRLGMVVKNGELRLSTPQARLARIREIMKPYIDPSRSLADELIAERREEQRREDERG